MSKIVFTPNASGTGNFTITSPNSNTNRQVDLPDAAGGIVIDSATQTLTNKTLASPTISGTPVMSASVITSGTANTSLSGSAIDFTGIPSWVKRVTVMFNGVSTNGTSNILVQIGSGSVTTSGYNSAGAGCVNAAAPALGVSTAGFIIYNDTATDVRNGHIVITLMGSNLYSSSHILGGSSTRNVAWWGAGVVTLTGSLDRVRITMSNGTDAFDSGAINIFYE